MRSPGKQRSQCWRCAAEQVRCKPSRRIPVAGSASRFSTLGFATPVFWIGLMLIVVFSVHLRWFPVSGMSQLSYLGGGGFWDVAHHLVLPSIALALVAVGVIARLTRSAMLEVLRQDFVRTARAKGVGEGAVVWRHAFKAAMVSVVPVLGLQAGFVLSGAVYIEKVFEWPGVGRLLVDAILKRDLLLVMGGVVLVASIYVLFNILVDVVQALLDPRITA